VQTCAEVNSKSGPNEFYIMDLIPFEFQPQALETGFRVFLCNAEIRGIMWKDLVLADPRDLYRQVECI